MARNWSYDEKKGVLTRSYEGGVMDLTCKLEDLFPGFPEDFDEAQQGTIFNGVKQKLDDSIARPKELKLSEVEKRTEQEALWLRLTVDRKWNMEGAGVKQRGPSVSLKTLVPALQAAGLNAQAIALATGKSLDVIQKFIETGVEEE